MTPYPMHSDDKIKILVVTIGIRKATVITPYLPKKDSIKYSYLSLSMIT